MDHVKRLNEGGHGTHASIGGGSGAGAGAGAGGEAVDNNNNNNTPRGKPGGNQDHDADNGHGAVSSSQQPTNGVKQPMMGASKSMVPLPSPSTPASMSSSGSKLFVPASISPLTSDGGNGIDVKKKKSWLLSRK